jgi:hypothetical protein
LYSRYTEKHGKAGKTTPLKYLATGNKQKEKERQEKLNALPVDVS